MLEVTSTDQHELSEVGQNSTPSPIQSDSGTEVNQKALSFSQLVWRHTAGFVFFFGSGLLTCVAYLDPGNLVADIQLGVGSGYALLWWTAVCCMVFGMLFQCMAGRVGLVTKQDLSELIGKRYALPTRILLWMLVEIAIVAADIQETIGSAIGLSILTNGKVPLWGGCIIISITAFGILLLERMGFRQLEAVFGLLITLEAICMGVNFVQADIPSVQVARGFIPKLDSNTVVLAAGALGALVMPYNVFFQSAVVNLRPRDLGDRAQTRTLLAYLQVENFIVLLVAFIVNLFVICVFAAGFYGVLDPDDAGLESAGENLAERFGSVFQTIWAIGLLSSGQVATIGLTFAGQMLMSGLLNFKVRAGPRMLGTRLVSLIPTVTLAVVFSTSNTFDTVAQILNVVQSLVLPFALIPLVHVAADFKLLGEFSSHRFMSAFAALVTLVIFIVNEWTFYQFMTTTLPNIPAVIAPSCVFMFAYFLLVAYFAVGPDNVPAVWQETRTRALKCYAYLRSHVHRVDWESVVEVHH